MLFTITLITIILVFITCLLYIHIYFDKSDFNMKPKNTNYKNIDKKKLIKHLNYKWNVDPYKHINDTDGAQKSLVFFHYIDNISDNHDLNNKWKINNYIPLSSLFHKNNITDNILLPSKSISFIGGNKNIFSFTYSIPEYTLNYGIIFDFTYEDVDYDNINPLCFWATDGSTINRKNKGCSSWGFQLENNSKTNNKVTKFEDKLRAEINRIKILLKEDRYSAVYWINEVLNRDSLTFKEFLLINKYIKSLDLQKKPKDKDFGLNNEILINSWQNDKLNMTPIVAFFYNENATSEEILEIKKIRKSFEIDTLNKIPVIKFDTNNNTNPFS